MKCYNKICVLLLVIVFCVSGCLHSEDSKSGIQNYIYAASCQDGENAYLSVNERENGLFKYKGTALRVRGKKENEFDAVYRTSDSRISLSRKDDNQLFIRISGQGIVQCTITGHHEPES